MSWMKRPRASPGTQHTPGQNIFNPTQPPMPGINQPTSQQQWPHQPHSMPQQQLASNYSQQNIPPAQEQPQFWQTQQQMQPQPNQQQNMYNTQQHMFQQQNYPSNDPYQYNQQLNTQQRYQNYQQPSAQLPNSYPQSGEVRQGWEATTQDTVGDSWDWGWQDDGMSSQQQNVANQQTQQENIAQQNANIIANSFSNSGDSWNWSLDDQQKNQAESQRHQKETTPQSRESSQDSVIHKNVGHSLSPLPQPRVEQQQQPFVHSDSNIGVPSNDNNNKSIKITSDASASNVPHLPVSEPNIKNLSDKGALLEHNNSLPNITLPRNRRYLNDTLTPQWSTESQPSQDSSDGLLTESTTNRSEDPSTKSSPSFCQDNTNFNYPQSMENVPDNLWNNSRPVESNQTSTINEIIPKEGDTNQELVESVQRMNLNRNSVSPHQGANSLPMPVPPLDRNSPNTPLLPPTTMKPPSNISNFPPPQSGAGSSGANPFKRAGQLSHKTASKLPTQQITGENISIPSTDQQYNQQDQSPSTLGSQNVRQPSPVIQVLPLSSPRIVQQQNYTTANLETTPDNSERPDVPAPVPVLFRPVQQYPHGSPVVQNTVENFEVAPNDRNEYLQMRHLSDSLCNNINYADDNIVEHNPNISQDNYPPPGLRRMVLGQPESEFNQSSNDEPPPGLSRMVPGQLNDASNMYTQPNDDYLDRQVDGQTTESESLNSSYMNRAPNVYNRVGDGQPTDDESNYTPNPPRSVDRRPVGSDRMIPGESSNFQSFQGQNFLNNTRYVTGFDQNATPERRDQNMDGSDFSGVDTTSQIRSIVGVETVDDRNTGPVSNDGSVINLREVNMEGENLQDLSVVSSTDFSFVRDQNMDGANVQDEAASRPVDIPESGSERQGSSQMKKDITKTEGDRKFHDDTTGDESERDRYNRKMKKDKERMKSSRERDSRYSGDKRDDRKERDRKGGDRDDERSFRRGNRDARYETEDTDYYSDRDRRRYREGSYTSSSKPPRPDRRGDQESRRSYDRSLRDDDRDSRRHRDGARYNSSSNKDDGVSYESDHEGYGTSGRKRGDKDRSYDDRDGSRRYDRHDGYSSLSRKNKSRDIDRKRDSRYPPRPNSRDPDPAEDDDPNNETGGSMSLNRREGRVRQSVDRDERGRHKRESRRERDRGYNQQYYDSRYGAYGMDTYSQQMYQHQQQTYQYYEKLRITNPQAYMEIYAKYLSGQRLPYTDGYNTLPSYDLSSSSRLADERASVDSGKSSTNGEAIKDRMLFDTSLGGGSNISALNNSYFYPIRSGGAYRVNAPHGHRRIGSGSIRTDISDSRDYNTDSINFGLENSTVKSERLTPVKFATAHIKGIVSSTNLVTVTPCYPADGQPALVEILDLNKILINDPVRCELTIYPGPLIKGTSHKKTVIEYCEMKIREAIEHNTYGDKSGYYSKQPHSIMITSGNSNSLSERQTMSSISHLPGNADIGSYVLMWDLLILLLRQNGMVVGTDIAELLVKNKKQFEWRSGNSGPPTGIRNLSRRGSNSSVTSRSAEMPIEEVLPGEENTGNLEGEDSSNEAGSANAKQRAISHQQVKQTSASNSFNVRRTSSNANILESPTHEKYVTDKFREYLLFGSVKEALEWAMSHGLWGHALFLASKMDKRTYANVMMRFANGLAANDPLQTLYQLMSGRQPASVTCVFDDKWGDWRPHLAMILSNTTQRPELDRKSITTLGDTLLSRGDVYAAHFCYLMSREEPGSNPGSRLQLLGLPLPTSTAGNTATINNPYKSPSHNIIMTEIYEYACSLNQAQRAMGHFQFYKYLLATRLVDCGLYERALLYLESIADAVVQEPHQYQGPFLQRVLDLADRLKYFDPEENVGEMTLEDQQDSIGMMEGLPSSNITGNRASGDKPWLTSLRDTVDQIVSDPSSHAPYSATQFIDQQQHYQTFQQHNLCQQQNQLDSEWASSTPQPHSMQQHIGNSNYDPLQMQQQKQQQYSQFDQQQQNSQFDQQSNTEVSGDNYHPQMYDPNSVQHGQQNYVQPQSYSQSDTKEGVHDYSNPPQVPSESGANSYWNQDQQYGHHENRETLDSFDPPRPQISMPNSSIRTQHDDSDQDGDQQKLQQKSQQKVNKDKKDMVAPTAKTPASSGWFGGIFNKLSLKPKNQMILPDDKNPSIVWDSEKKRWVNLDADEQEREAQLAPPPKMADIIKPNNNTINNNIPPPTTPDPPVAASMLSNNANPLNSNTTSAQPPPASVPNIFKLQKSRHIKKAYVDVFNPSGAPMKPLAPASEVLGDPMMMSSQPQGPPTTYFVPGPGAPTSEQNNPTFYNPADYH